MTLILFRVDATSNVHQLDFNKRILILEMHGTNIKTLILLYITNLLMFYKAISAAVFFSEIHTKYI